MRRIVVDNNAEKFINYLRSRHPLSDKEIPEILSSVKRLTSVVQKIINEPQAQISYPVTIKEGKQIKKRLVKTDVTELTKVADKNQVKMPGDLIKFMELFKADGKK